MPITDAEVYFDPFDAAIKAHPYPRYKRLRDEAPLYYNDRYDFYAVTRFEDVQRAMADPQTFVSGRGGILSVIKAEVRIPPGLFIFEDPPLHTAHRGLVSRVFTPRAVAAIEPQVRAFCARTLDRIVGTGSFDFVRDLGDHLPMAVIGMLLGIPEADNQFVREHLDEQFDAGHPDRRPLEGVDRAGDLFGDYLDWRTSHPSDDLMTQLLTIEFEDETGAVRRLRRDEILTYVNLIAGAGADTTRRLIGWMGKVLGDHPDQRRELAEDPSLIPNAVEELLRYEPPTYQNARYVIRDAEFHGRTVPAGSALIFLPGAANRDERRFPDPDRFDIHRNVGHILTFGFGIHFCLGAPLARLEGQVALEEILRRFPSWVVDSANATMQAGAELRGWESLPTSIG